MLRLKNNTIIESILILLGIAMVLASLMILPGCSKEENVEKDAVSLDQDINQVKIKAQSNFKEVARPDSMYYWVNNSIEHLYNEESENYRYVFEGLLDKDIQDKVNGEITRRHQNLKYADIPPYRGIRTVIDSEANALNSATSTFYSFSAFNLLSVQSINERTYPNKENSKAPIYTTVMDCYNVDLTTGKELKLIDLFANDAEYETLLNNYILNEMKRLIHKEHNFYSDDQLEQVYPFSGIKENQKFILTPYDLQIILDYETPEFETGFTYSIIHIPYKDLEGTIAIKERFYDDVPNLFEENKPKFELIPYYPNNVIAESEQVIKDNHLTTYIRSYPENTPEKLKTLFIDNAEFGNEEVNELEEGVIDNGFTSKDYSCAFIGPFFKTSIVETIHKGNQSEFRSSGEIYTLEGEIVKLEDLFIAEYEFDSLINSRMVTTINQQVADPQETIEEIKESLTYTLTATAINFSSKPLDFGNNQLEPLWFYIEFEDFGFENLTFFN